jgi:hypothetical protein
MKLLKLSVEKHVVSGSMRRSLSRISAVLPCKMQAHDDRVRQTG